MLSYRTGLFLLCALGFLVALPRVSNAIPASPHAIVLKQPDGTKITLHINGDEYFHWFSDLNGFTVMLDQGQYVYADLVNDELKVTELVVGRDDPAAAGLTPHLLPSAAAIDQLRARGLPRAPQGMRLPNGVAPFGTVKNLVVLCMFSDHAVGVNGRVREDYDILFDAIGGDPVLAPTGSLRDCYNENSYGALSLESTVAAWVTLPNPESYYANGTSGLGGSYPANSQGMVEDALDLVDQLIDFGEFDTNNDGFIDAISIVHSGFGAETGGGGGNWIWSHKWSLFALPGGNWTSNDTNDFGQNVRVSDYHTEPALWGTSGTQISRIGVVAHETGHFFGLPDLYDTNGGGQGLGSYGMMANSWGFDGSQLHPPHFSAWSKIFLGWVTPTLIEDPGLYVAPQVETNPVVFRIDDGYPDNEYLLIENRQPVGLDSAMPQGGLAIWHIDNNQCCNSNEGHPGQADWPENGRHYRVALMQADGDFDLERGNNRGDAGDLYHGNAVYVISQDTLPNTDAYQGGNIVVTQNSIFDISVAGSEMTFRVIADADCNGNDVSDLEDISTGFSLDCSLAPFPHNCCAMGHGSGCDDIDIEACVCSNDIFCCLVLWDSTCISEVEFFGCGSCAGSEGNGIPDECEPDCNLNGEADSCDISNSTSFDCNANTIPDSCDIAEGVSSDVNQDGVPDECGLPVITQHPSNQVGCEGEPVTFSVQAEGSPPLNYQWQLDGVDVFGANSASLTLNSPTAADAGSYRCLVSNSVDTAASNPASLAIITNAECDDGSFCNGVESCADAFCVAAPEPACPGEYCDEGASQCGVVGDGHPTLSVMAAEINGVDVGPAPQSSIIAPPGSTITVEFFVRDWSPAGQELKAYEFLIDSSGYSSGAAGNIYPRDWSATTDVNGCSTGGPDGEANGANAFVDLADCFANDTDPAGEPDPVGSDMGPWSYSSPCTWFEDCLTGAPCESPSIDWIHGGISLSNVDPTVISTTCDYRFANSLSGAAAGRISNQDGSSYYLGTVILKASNDAEGVFTLCLDSADVEEPFGDPEKTFLRDQDNAAIMPIVVECLEVTVSGELNSCTANGECDDADPCSSDICDSEVCTFWPRLFGDANNDGARNLIDVICSARVVFQNATLCGTHQVSLDEIDIAPGVACGDEQLNIIDVVAHARAAFQDEPDECCE